MLLPHFFSVLYTCLTLNFYFSFHYVCYICIDFGQTPPRAVGSPGDTDCESENDNENRGEDEEEVQCEDGYMSGAESDSGLVDARQSINLVMKNLQVDNQTLKAKLKATLANKTLSPERERIGHQVGGVRFFVFLVRIPYFG